MTADELRDIVRRPASLDDVRALGGDVAMLLGTPFFAHIADVYGRLERVAGDRDDAWLLKLAVLVHEEPPLRAAALVTTCGLAAAADVVRDVLGGFGAVWKIRTAAEIDAYVAARLPHLEALLIFELAHEGRPTPMMVRVASAAGLEAQLAAWSARLTLVGRAIVMPQDAPGLGRNGV